MTKSLKNYNLHIRITAYGGGCWTNYWFHVHAHSVIWGQSAQVMLYSSLFIDLNLVGVHWVYHVKYGYKKIYQQKLVWHVTRWPLTFDPCNCFSVRVPTNSATTKFKYIPRWQIATVAFLHMQNECIGVLTLIETCGTYNKGTVRISIVNIICSICQISLPIMSNPLSQKLVQL